MTRVEISATDIAVIIGLDPYRHPSELIPKIWHQLNRISYLSATAQPLKPDAKITLNAKAPSFISQSTIQEMITEASSKIDLKGSEKPRQVVHTIKTECLSSMQEEEKFDMMQRIKKELYTSFGKFFEYNTIVLFSILAHMSSLCFISPKDTNAIKMEKKKTCLRKSYVIHAEDINVHITGTPDAVSTSENAVVEVKNRVNKYSRYRNSSGDRVQLHVYMKTHAAKHGYLVEHFRFKSTELLVSWRVCKGKSYCDAYKRRYILDDTQSTGRMQISYISREDSEYFWKQTIEPGIKRFFSVLKNIMLSSMDLQETFFKFPIDIYDNFYEELQFPD